MFSRKKKKIIIFSGAFNPPHIGHAVVVETAARLFPCNEIWLMPTANRQDKNIEIAGKHRIKMLNLMKKELFHFPPVRIKISTLELDRPRLTATYETKLELERLYPNCEFYFLVGSDIVGDIEKRLVQRKKLFKTGKFIIFIRHPYPLPKKLPPHSTVLDKNTQCLDFSSTFTRNLLKKHRYATPYVTLKVAQYIKKQKLYY